ELELLALAADVLAAAGLRDFKIDLGDAGIVRELMHDVPRERVAAVTNALARKDEAMLVELTGDLASGSRLRELARLHGGRDVLLEATRLTAGTRAEVPAKRLLALFDAACARGLGTVLSADPGEVRGFAYYTGTIFSLYAEGPGEAI